MREKEWLLVLDNFEQVVQAAPELERLLANCPRVRVLVTSRAGLHLPSEYQYRLFPLAVPNLKQQLDSVTVAQSPSVQLFLQRARTLLPTFQVTESNAVTLAKICMRLDGLPLALELAAARIRLLPPHALLPRLSRRLHVLTKGLPALPERQQTLRNTLEWSYNLLDAGAQRFFRLLSLFVGGFTIEAAEALFAGVIGGNNSSISSALDGLDALIDYSLLQPAVPTDASGESRLLMLETIREFGRERLLESDDMARAREAHAFYYLKLAEEAAQDVAGSQQGPWLDRLDQEHGNLQAAMEWMLAPEDLAAAKEKDAGKKVLALRLGNALRWFWIARGYQSEGWRFIEQALQAYEEREAEVTLSLAQAYLLAASLSTRLGKLERAERLVEQGIIPLENRLPGVHSFQSAIELLTGTRVTVSWIATGLAMAAYEVALDYAKQRKQFGRPLAAFQMIQYRLATMVSKITNMQLMSLRLSQLQDEGKLTSARAALGKLTTARLAREVIADARDMLGANGLLFENLIARYHADIEAIVTYDGPDAIQALIVGQAITGEAAFGPSEEKRRPARKAWQGEEAEKAPA